MQRRTGIGVGTCIEALFYYYDYFISFRGAIGNGCEWIGGYVLFQVGQSVSQSVSQLVSQSVSQSVSQLFQSRACLVCVMIPRHCHGRWRIRGQDKGEEGRVRVRV